MIHARAKLTIFEIALPEIVQQGMRDRKWFQQVQTFLHLMNNILVSLAVIMAKYKIKETDVVIEGLTDMTMKDGSISSSENKYWGELLIMAKVRLQ